jgi:hypothetical protein
MTPRAWQLPACPRLPPRTFELRGEENVDDFILLLPVIQRLTLVPCSASREHVS